MDSLTLLSSSSPLLKPNKLTQFPSLTHYSLSPNSPLKPRMSANSVSKLPNFKPKLHLTIPTLMGFLHSSTFPSIAAEFSDPVSQRIDLESILVSIDNFFIKYPYSLAGVTFIWLIVIPLLEDYFEKFQFISALNAFKKLRDDSSVQLLDIRDEKSLGFLSSPRLRIFKKDGVNVAFVEGDEDGFLDRVKGKFLDHENTVVCILDNFDGNSMKVAELLFKKGGFKEAYAIKGGVRGMKGWQEIQEEFFPPAVHVFRRKKSQKAPQPEENGAATLSDVDQVPAAASDK